MSKTLHFLVTIPDISDGMADETVLEWVSDSINHPDDAYLDASITVVPVPTSMVPTNPERDGNGCMIYGKGGTE